MSEELDILKTVTQRLEKAKIPYMITGSIALNFYAMPRMTRDIDIVIELQQGHTKILLDLFQEDFYVDEETIKEALKNESLFNIIHQQSVFKIDFIIRKNSPYRELEFQRRQSITLGNARIWIVSAEDLILAKLYWARDSFSEMQLQDVKALLESAGSLDIDYIKKWVNNLELKEIYEKVKI